MEKFGHDCIWLLLTKLDLPKLRISLTHLQNQNGTRRYHCQGRFGKRCEGSGLTRKQQRSAPKMDLNTRSATRMSVEWNHDIDTTLTTAKSENRPALMDFSATPA
jgi:hypothetical protein